MRADLCIGCGLCVTLGNPTAPQIREFGCPADYDAINMMPFELVVKALETSDKEETTTSIAASLQNLRAQSREPKAQSRKSFFKS